VRDVSDDGPVGGFVTEEMLREQEREMEDFANMKKEDFNNSEASKSETTFADMEEDQKDTWKEIEDNIKEIEKDREMTLEDKSILLYNIFEDYKNGMPMELQSRILVDLESLDRQLIAMKKEEGLKAKEEKMHQRISDLKTKLDLQKLKTRKIPTKSTENLESSERKQVTSESKDTRNDYEHVLEKLIAEAEAY
jgi:hypothetical protein